MYQLTGHSFAGFLIIGHYATPHMGFCNTMSHGTMVMQIKLLVVVVVVVVFVNKAP